MAQQPLQSQKGDAFLHGGDCQGTPPHMRRHAHGVMDRAMRCDEWLDPRGKREHTAFGWDALQTAFAVDHETMALPVNMLLCEVSLRDAQSSGKQGPAHQTLLMGRTGRHQAVSVVRSEVFAFVLGALREASHFGMLVAPPSATIHWRRNPAMSTKKPYTVNGNVL